MGYFNEEYLHRFNLMCSEGVNFAEEGTYDFARCIKADGEIYGVSPGETCKEGKPISGAKAKRETRGETSSRMAKLRAAFIKKWKREMSPEELEKARNMVSRPKAQKKEG